jgi:hypothetical protein
MAAHLRTDSPLYAGEITRFEPGTSGLQSGIVATTTPPHGEMETWRHGGMDMEAWTWIHGHGGMDMDTWTWRHGHGDMDIKK